jgi:thiamine biosynthesis lipoprotein
MRSLVDWTAVQFDPSRIAFAHPGMAITLNGVAQGFITDRIAAKLRGFGLADVLIDIGEIRGWGRSPGGGPWRVGIAGPDGDEVAERITLTDRALATSATFGTVMDEAGNIGHILSPATGVTASHVRQVSVSAPRADIADGLSTALCAMGPTDGIALLKEFPEARLESVVI